MTDDSLTPDKQTAFLGKVENSFFNLGLEGFDEPLVLMVSGGSDSVSLLLLTYGLCISARGNAENILVLHVNHQLRGAEADGEERFVVRLCENLGVRCTVEQVDVAALAKETGVGVEQAGRSLRYGLAEKTRAAFLSELAEKAGAGKQGGMFVPSVPSICYILTAHTADDRAETLLQRLIVGGGSGSLASIPKRNGNVLRPLLDCTRQELRDWLIARNVQIDGFLWREDATNFDTSYSRAFVRHELLPLLAERNPRIVEGLNRTANMLASESAWLDEQALRLLPLTKSSFCTPLPLLRRAIYLACNQAISELAPEARITFEHIDLISREGDRSGFACQIPGGIEVRNVRGILQFNKAEPPKHDPRNT